MTQVKICGIQTTQDGLSAVKHGADAIGFLFSESKRRVDPISAREIIEKLPVFTTSVGVFVNEDFQRVNEIASYCRLSYVQLHGNESPEYCQKIRTPYIKTIKLKSPEDMESIKEYDAMSFLLDTYVEGKAGGTGQTFDWSMAKNANLLGKFILAGGLTTENVGKAIIEVKPIAVDVSSGVESEGVKDERKISSFIDAVKKAKH